MNDHHSDSGYQYVKAIRLQARPVENGANRRHEPNASEKPKEEKKDVEILIGELDRNGKHFILDLKGLLYYRDKKQEKRVAGKIRVNKKWLKLHFKDQFYHHTRHRQNPDKQDGKHRLSRLDYAKEKLDAWFEEWKKGIEILKGFGGTIFTIPTQAIRNRLRNSETEREIHATIDGRFSRQRLAQGQGKGF